MNEENQALPNAESVEASQEAGKQEATDGAKSEAASEQAEKPEKTEQQRQLERMQKGIDRKTRQAAQARAENAMLREQLTKYQNGVDYKKPDGDSDALSITRADFDKAVKEQAERLAKTQASEFAERDRREIVVNKVAKEMGAEKFDKVAAELNEAFGGDDLENGLLDRNGQIKPAVEAIFNADHPASLIEYLADPNNAEEAERIASMGVIQAVKAIDRLEAKLKDSRAKSAPKASNAPAPIDAVKSGGVVTGAPNAEADPKAWREWANKQEYGRK